MGSCNRCWVVVNPSVLFELPFDSSLADEERAQEILPGFLFEERDEDEGDETEIVDSDEVGEELNLINGFDCAAEFERLENMTEDEFDEEFWSIIVNESLDYEDKQTACVIEFRFIREAERLESMNFAEMTYDELADFLEARIERDIANGEPEAIIAGTRCDREGTLSRMREMNIEIVEVWYDDYEVSISLTHPDYAE